MDALYEVVWPGSPSGVAHRVAAQRLSTLDGARIGFVWDYMFRGEEIFPAIEAALRDRFPSIEFVTYDVFGNIHGPDEHALVDALPDRLHQHRIDAVLVGNGC
jgi:hypothetical protein